MPIRPENKARYPKDWKAISRHIRKRSGGRCECEGECGKPHAGRCAALNGQQINSWKKSVIVLTVGHLNHTPEDCRDENLKAWCQGCHLRYDSDEHARTRARTLDGKIGQGRFDV